MHISLGNTSSIIYMLIVSSSFYSKHVCSGEMVVVKCKKRLHPESIDPRVTTASFNDP